MEALHLAESFERISSNRISVRSFDRKKLIPSETMTRVLRLTSRGAICLQSAAIQNHRGTQSPEGKDALCQAMLGSNVKKVADAPVTVVFAADKDPARNARKLMDLELAHGKSQEYVASLPSKITFLLGKGWLSTKFGSVVTHLTTCIGCTKYPHHGHYDRMGL